LLGALAKFRKADISFDMPVSPSVFMSIIMEKLGSQLVDFRGIYCFSIFQKPAEKIQLLLQI